MVACAAAGHRSFCSVGRAGEGKIIPAQVLPGLQGKDPCGKKPFCRLELFACCLFFIGAHYLATLGLWSFLFQDEKD
jgi:hypothetical protein